MASYKLYWKNRVVKKGDRNSPHVYAKPTPFCRVYDVLQDIKVSGAGKDSKILEIGCNAGRNLNEFRKAGFTDLSGLDINPHAIIHMKKAFPELAQMAKLYVGEAGKTIHTLSDTYDVVYTLAVLMHLDDQEQKEIFRWMSQHARTVILIEKPYQKRVLSKRLFNPLHLDQLKRRNFRLVSKSQAKKGLNDELQSYTTFIFRNMGLKDYHTNSTN
jgi:SAM-dependent methyltransferase